MTKAPAPPTPADLADLRPANAAGAWFVLAAAAPTAAGLWLSSLASLPAWIVGQLLTGLALVEWFIVLHECGHGTLFRSRRLNVAVGQVAGFFSLIPFRVWARVHQRHHKWTGWQDMDPTTASLVPRPLSRAERVLVNICWRWWIPLFSILYRANNFWNFGRLRRLFPARDIHVGLILNGVALVLAYAAIGAWIGPAALVRLSGAALLIAFAIEDVLLISQHTHIPMGLSGGRSVDPYPTLEQEQFTRSLKLPAWLSRLALHFDDHELHHMYPFVPGYRLGGVPYTTANGVRWSRWVPAARAVPGDVLLFQSRNESGFDV